MPLSSFKATRCSTCSIRDCNFNITNGHNSYRLPQSRQSSWWIWIYPRYNNQFTRYAEAYASTNNSSKTAAEKLFNDFVFKFGTSNRILHGQGKEFESKLFDVLEKYFGIKRCITLCATTQLSVQTLQSYRCFAHYQKNWNINRKIHSTN